MKDKIDFTKCRQGTKPYGRIIAQCPKCGKNGQKTVYQDGTVIFAHFAVFNLGFLTIKESCYVCGGDNGQEGID